MDEFSEFFEFGELTSPPIISSTNILISPDIPESTSQLSYLTHPISESTNNSLKSENQIQNDCVTHNYFTDRMIIESYKTLIGQMIDRPIDLPRFIAINGIGRYLIGYNDFKNMMEMDQIEKCVIDPTLQIWAGPEGSQNIFLNFIRKSNNLSDDQTYIVKVYFDHKTGKVYPPIKDHDFSNLWIST